MNARTDVAPAARHVLEIGRAFDAPPALVFKLWSNREHLLRWWGPKDFTATSQQFEFRPGGVWRHTIHSPDGQSHRMSGIFREIIEPERIVFTFAWDENGGMPGQETLVTVTIAAEGAGTLLTFRQEPFASVENRDSHAEGWGECLDRLGAYLAAL